MDEIVAWLKRLINYNTTASGAGAEDCAGFIRDALASKGAVVRTFSTDGGVRTAHHLLAEVRGENSDTVMLHAHLDTDGYGIREEWLFPAEKASLRHGCICGRGAIDCKGQLAVWMKLLSDACECRQPYTLRLMVTDLEESGGQFGLCRLLEEHLEILADVKLVNGEGGGFPFPFEDRIYYTFQTEERENYMDPSGADNALGPDAETIKRILSMGIEKGYYNGDLLSYAAKAGSLSGRRLDLRPLYSGMESYFEQADVSEAYGKYGIIFEEALRRQIPNARLMPCITPGYSDNRWFRNAGVPVVGFFPLDLGNSLRGIHGCNEYISRDSLYLAYHVLGQILDRLSFSDDMET